MRLFQVVITRSLQQEQRLQEAAKKFLPEWSALITEAYIRGNASTDPPERKDLVVTNDKEGPPKGFDFHGF